MELDKMLKPRNIRLALSDRQPEMWSFPSRKERCLMVKEVCVHRLAGWEQLLVSDGTAAPPNAKQERLLGSGV